MEPPQSLKIFLMLTGAAACVCLVQVMLVGDMNLSVLTIGVVQLEQVKPKSVPVVPTKKIQVIVETFHHRHWRTNCSALFSGDKRVTTEALKMLKKARTLAPLPLPTDKEVQNWTVDCSLYRNLRQYPKKPRSDEEARYPIAYSIMVHKDSVQLERLLRAIYQPQNIICIHPDKKSKQDFKNTVRGLANCFDNVFVASKLDNVEWGGMGMLTGDINCMVDLTGDVGIKYNWKYLINLCGQDFPLKTNLEIVRQLKAYKGHNDINGITFDIGGKYKYYLKNKGKPPHKFTLFRGNRYMAASRPFVEFVMNDPKAKDMLKWANGTHCPEEFYWVTLHRAKGTPGGYPIGNLDSSIRFVRWRQRKNLPPCQSKYVRNACIFAIDYLQHFAVMPYLFANKFYYNYDPVALQCLEEALNNRTLYPQESDKLIGFPVTKYKWQNYTEVP